MDFMNFSQLIQDPGEQATLETAIRSAILATGADEGSLLLLRPDELHLEFAMCCTREGINHALIGQRVPVTEGLVGMAVQSGETQIGAPTYKRLKQANGSGEAATDPSSVLAAPLVHNDAALGVITLVSFNPQVRFTASHALHYEALAKLVALLLHKQAVVGELTRQSGSGHSGGPEARLLRAASVLAAGSPERLQAVAGILEAFATLK